MTASALLAFAVVQVVQVPFHGLWAVLTAIVVTQASTGGSIRASLEYLLGTVCGALYGTLVSLAVPHATPLMMGVALALAIIPLAYAAASSAIFRVAPFTAVIVLLLGGEAGQSPVMAATTRFFEVALGGVIAVVVSLLVFPERAHSQGRALAASAMERLAATLPVILGGLFERIDVERMGEMQDRLGAAITLFNATIAEARHEQAVSLGAQVDSAPLSRTLLRLRHDLVIVGRAAAEPLPDIVAEWLGPQILGFGSTVSRYLNALAAPLRERQAPPDDAEVDQALDAFTAQVAAMREDGATRPLSTAQAEQLFALGFAFQEIRRNLSDLRRCIDDWLKR